MIPVLTLVDLELLIRNAIDAGAKYIAVAFKIGDYPKAEIIINPIANAAEKLEYYLTTYNHDLSHKYSPTVKITDFVFGNSFGEIERYFQREGM